MKLGKTMNFNDRCKFMGYGSAKKALLHCQSLNMGPSQAAAQLESSWHTVKRYAEHYGIDLEPKTPGYKRLAFIEHNGVVWYPCDVTYHYLRSKL